MVNNFQVLQQFIRNDGIYMALNTYSHNNFGTYDAGVATKSATIKSRNCYRLFK